VDGVRLSRRDHASEIQICVLFATVSFTLHAVQGISYKSIFGVPSDHIHKIPAAVQKLNPMTKEFYEHPHIAAYNTAYDDMVALIIDKACCEVAREWHR
jgi:hypothetical protein